MKISPIDFVLVYGGDEVLRLRQELDQITDQKSREELDKSIEKKYTPSERETIVILIENLFDVFEG